MVMEALGPIIASGAMAIIPAIVIIPLFKGLGGIMGAIAAKASGVANRAASPMKGKIKKDGALGAERAKAAFNNTKVGRALGRGNARRDAKRARQDESAAKYHAEKNANEIMSNPNSTNEEKAAAQRTLDKIETEQTAGHESVLQSRIAEGKLNNAGLEAMVDDNTLDDTERQAAANILAKSVDSDALQRLNKKKKHSKFIQKAVESSGNFAAIKAKNAGAVQYSDEIDADGNTKTAGVGDYSKTGADQSTTMSKQALEDAFEDNNFVDLQMAAAKTDPSYLSSHGNIMALAKSGHTGAQSIIDAAGLGSAASAANNPGGSSGGGPGATSSDSARIHTQNVVLDPKTLKPFEVDNRGKNIMQQVHALSGDTSSTPTPGSIRKGLEKVSHEELAAMHEHAINNPADRSSQKLNEYVQREADRRNQS
jgi:hypothetical protein